MDQARANFHALLKIVGHFVTKHIFLQFCTYSLLRAEYVRVTSSCSTDIRRLRKSRKHGQYGIWESKKNTSKLRRTFRLHFGLTPRQKNQKNENALSIRFIAQSLNFQLHSEPRFRTVAESYHRKNQGGLRFENF